MSEASELLKSLSDVEYESYSAASPVNDVIEIDANGRFINIPRTEVLLGVETDKDVERKYFRCPRIVGDNIDLTKLQLRVNYQNADQEKDAHIVQDVTVDGQYINFSWKLSDKVLAAQGTVFFAIQAVSSEQDGTLKNRWNTTLASGNVLETLIVELDYYEEEQARELLTELLQMMDNKSAESIQKIQKETTTQLGRINTTGTQQVQAVADEGVRVLETIPADYQETYKMADEGIRTKVDAFTNELESQDTIVLTNAANDPLRGLKLYGKTKQATTNGHQLFDASRLTTRTGGNVTLTNHGDGSFTISGSGSAGDFGGYYNLTHEETLALFKVGTLYLANDTITYPYFYVETVVNNNQLSVVTNSGSIELTQDFFDNATSFIRIGFYGGSKNITTGTVKPMLYQDGDGTWEPFSGGQPSPNPDYPQELDSLGEFGNLFDKDDPNSIINAYCNMDENKISNNDSTRSVFIACKPNTIYSISKKSGQRFHVYYTKEKPANGVAIYNVINLDGTTTTTYTTGVDAKYLLIYCHHSSYDTVTPEEIIDSIMLNYGTTPLPWRSYTGQKEIESRITGKNLLEFTATTRTINGLTFTVNEDRSVTINGTNTSTSFTVFELNPNYEQEDIYFGVRKGTVLRLTGCPKNGGGNTYWLDIQRQVTINSMDTGIGKEFVVDKNAFKPRIVVASGITMNNVTFYPMVRLASVEDDSFEPYRGGSLYTPVSSGLPGLPLGQTIPDEIKNSPAHMSGVYWDEEDQQYYISDTVDYENGKYEQRINVKVFNGTEYINDLIGQHNAMTYEIAHMNNSNFICTHAVTNNDAVTWSNATYILFRPSYFNATTIDEFKAFLSEEYRNGTPLTVQYILATPTTRDLTATEMSAYRALRTNKPTTVIFNDCKARMGVKYNVDLESKMEDDAAEERYESDLKYSGAIVQTIQGESLVATDSAKAPFLGMKLFGKTEQFTTTGKNLLDDAYRSSINTNVYYNEPSNNPPIRLQGGTTYTLTCFSEVIPAGLYLRNYNGGSDFALTYSKNTITYTPTTDVDAFINAYWSDSIPSDAVFMLEIGSEATDFEPYTGGQPSPSPDYPQELKSAGQASGQIESGVYGKNWLKSNLTTSKTLNGITITPNSDGSFSASGTATAAAVFENIGSAEVKKDNTYFLSGTPTGKGVNTYQLYLTGAANPTIYEVVKRATTVATDGTMNLSFIVYSGQTINFTVYPQLELGSEATAYEPYKQPQSLITKTPNGLPGIPLNLITDESLVNYTDVYGQKWICDEIDYKNGKYIQRIKTIVCNGNEGWRETTLENYKVFLSSEFADMKPNRTILCNIYQWSFDTKNRIITTSRGAGIYFWVIDDRYNTVEEFKAKLSENPMIIQYILVEPIIRDLTPEELKAFKALRSNYPTTTIMNDANAHMEASYVVDTKTYIDKKFAELAARLSTQS